MVKPHDDTVQIAKEAIPVVLNAVGIIGIAIFTAVGDMAAMYKYWYWVIPAFVGSVLMAINLRRTGDAKRQCKAAVVELIYVGILIVSLNLVVDNLGSDAGVIIGVFTCGLYLKFVVAKRAKRDVGVIEATKAHENTHNGKITWPLVLFALGVSGIPLNLAHYYDGLTLVVFYAYWLIPLLTGATLMLMNLLRVEGLRTRRRASLFELAYVITLIGARYLVGDAYGLESGLNWATGIIISTAYVGYVVPKLAKRDIAL